MSDIALADGDRLTPSFEHAQVADAMRHGVIACPPSMPLRAVARMMTEHHVHSIVVTGREIDSRGHVDERAWAVVTDLDLVRAASRADDMMAAEAAAPVVPTVTPESPLAEAARLMDEEGTGHLVVVDRVSGAPVGVISSLDIAGNIAWARG